MKKFALGLAVSIGLASFATAPASAGEQGTVVTSTDTRLVMRDVRGDQDVDGSTTKQQRRSADIRHFRVGQKGDTAHVALTFRGSVRARTVGRWWGQVTLQGRDVDTDRTLAVFFNRVRTRTTALEPDGTQVICSWHGTQVSNQGRTVTLAVPRRCGWQELDVVRATTFVEGRTRDEFSSDWVFARSRLAWR